MPPPAPSNKPSPLVIPELLEEVVMHLPLRDILLCQRVDTHFRDVVQSSSNIKKVLFLEPATNKTIELGYDHAVRPLFNPFLMS